LPLIAGEAEACNEFKSLKLSESSGSLDDLVLDTRMVRRQKAFNQNSGITTPPSLELKEHNKSELLDAPQS